MKKEFYFILFIAIPGLALALKPGTDSSIVSKPTKKNIPTVTLRVHSMGLFNYMGKVVNYNPAADFLFTYKTRNSFGFSLFKVADLVDAHSDNNFTIAFANKTFHPAKWLTIAPNIGVNLEQQHAVVDHGSDLIFLLSSVFRINKAITIEHSAMLPNIAFERKHSDWINRIRVLYSRSHLDVSGLIWHNNALLDGYQYFSTGASVFYNRVPLGKKIKWGAGATSLWVASSSNAERVPKRLGVQFTTSLTLN